MPYCWEKMSAPESRNFLNQCPGPAGLQVPSKQEYSLSRRLLSISNTSRSQETTSSP